MAKKNNVNLNVVLNDEDAKEVVNAYKDTCKQTTKDTAKFLGLVGGGLMAWMFYGDEIKDGISKVWTGVKDGVKSFTGNFKKKETDAVDIIVEESK